MPWESNTAGGSGSQRPSRVSGVKSCIFLSGKVFICILYNNKDTERPAKSSISLPVALLTVQKDTIMQLVPKSLFYLCFNTTAWAVLTSEGLSAVTILVFSGCESQAPLLHSGVPA